MEVIKTRTETNDRKRREKTLKAERLNKVKVLSLKRLIKLESTPPRLMRKKRNRC